MMVNLKNIALAVLSICFLFLGCDDTPAPPKNTPAPNVISGKISKPVVPAKNKQTAKSDVKQNKAKPEKENSEPGKELADVVKEEKKPDHYNSQGKIDPFTPLIQEKKEEFIPVVEKKPKRILTPLEKVELSQIKLVAVIIMKNRQIAMVEEASGKGYEVGIGTYMGKNEGRVSEIKQNSILIKEVVRDYKGRLKERIQEIKLHKSDGGD